MKFLMIGDVVGSAGCEALCQYLPRLKRQYGADFAVVNGENSAEGNGIVPASAERIFAAGAEVITTGNHAFRRRESYALYDERETLLRPVNFPPSAPGHGVCVIDRGGYRFAVINLMGIVHLTPQLEDPFVAADRAIDELGRQGIRNILVDLHAEATGEKRALGFYLDGRVTAVIGTHTHVQTADEELLPGGTAYLSDAGMTGPTRSCLGVEPGLAIAMMRDKLPVRFRNADTPCTVQGCAVEFDPKTGKATGVERFCV